MRAILRGQRAFGLIHDRSKCGGLVHGQIGQNLTVHFDAGQRQTVDETRIRQRFIMGAHGRIDPLDPQGAEIALAVLAVTGLVLVRLVDGLCCHLEGILAATVIAFGLVDDLFVTRVGDCSAFGMGMF